MKDTRLLPGKVIGTRPFRLMGLILVVAAECLTGGGCCVNPEVRQTALDAACTDVPTEMQKISIPPYRVEAPDILSIEAVNNIRPESDTLSPVTSS